MLSFWDLVMLVLAVGFVWFLFQAIVRPQPNATPRRPAGSGSSRASGQAQRGDDAVGRMAAGLRELVDGGRVLMERPAVKHSLALVGAAYAAPWLLKRCRQCNPLLTLFQMRQLETMFANACTEWRRGRSVGGMLRPILALAVPDGELAYDLLLAFSHAYNTDDQPIDQTPSNWAGEPNEKIEKELGLLGVGDGVMAKLRSTKVCEPLLLALKSRPTCPITLDDLTTPEGRIDSDVAMLVQQTNSGTNTHVFLYRRAALEQWFAEQPNPINPINPVTRQPVHRNRDYLILS